MHQEYLLASQTFGAVPPFTSPKWGSQCNEKKGLLTVSPFKSLTIGWRQCEIYYKRNCLYSMLKNTYHVIVLHIPAKLIYNLQKIKHFFSIQLDKETWNHKEVKLI